MLKQVLGPWGGGLVRPKAVACRVSIATHCAWSHPPPPPVTPVWRSQQGRSWVPLQAGSSLFACLPITLKIGSSQSGRLCPATSASCPWGYQDDSSSAGPTPARVGGVLRADLTCAGRVPVPSPSSAVSYELDCPQGNGADIFFKESICHLSANHEKR